MYGSHVGRLDVLVRAHGQTNLFLIWTKSGNQGNLWKKASIDIGIGKFQVATNDNDNHNNNDDDDNENMMMMMINLIAVSLSFSTNLT